VRQFPSSVEDLAFAQDPGSYAMAQAPPLTVLPLRAASGMGLAVTSGEMPAWMMDAFRCRREVAAVEGWCSVLP
jgi:hypothetical protein